MSKPIALLWKWHMENTIGYRFDNSLQKILRWSLLPINYTNQKNGNTDFLPSFLKNLMTLLFIHMKYLLLERGFMWAYSLEQVMCQISKHYIKSAYLKDCLKRLRFLLLFCLSFLYSEWCHYGNFPALFANIAEVMWPISNQIL